MKLQYIIIYVDDVVKATVFYEKAFAMKTRFVHDSKTYAEMESGSTTLAFASQGMLESNTGIPAMTGVKNCFEIAFSSQDVQADFARAVRAGAKEIRGPEQKPWGQTVAYVQDDFGTLVEICSPVIK